MNLLMLSAMRCSLPVVSGEITHTGSGFGAKSSLTPLFYEFFDNADFTEGALASTLGFTQGASSLTLTETDGLIADHGCVTHTTTGSPDTDSYPHLYYVPASSHTRIFAMYNFKIERISGSGTTPFQLKGPRNSDNVEYDGQPRSTISFYPTADCTALSYSNMGLITSATNNGRDDNGQYTQAYKARWRSADWNLVELETYFGTVGVADGYLHPRMNGAVIGPFQDATPVAFDSEAMPFRQVSGDNIQYVSIFPGMDKSAAGDVMRMRVCDYYVDNTLERIVLGDASTWDACTQKVPLIPTAWADTSVTATMRKFPNVSPGGTVYSYVVNASGTVSAGVARTAI